MIKMLFSDLDGTLLLKDGVLSKGVSEENLMAIDKLIRNGVLFGVATGRHHTFLPKVLNLPMDYFDTVGQGGAEVLFRKEIIYQTVFTFDEIQSIMQLFEKYHYQGSLLLTTLGNNYIFNDINTEKYNNFKNKQHPHLPKDYTEVYDIPVSEYIVNPNNEKPCRICCWFDNEDIANEYIMMFKQLFQDKYSMIKSSPHSVEIMKDGANKGKGIFMIAQKLGIELSEIACVGDSENDIEMFQLIPHSYCMSHARKDLQARAKYTTHSVAEAIDHILECNKLEKR